MNNHHAHSLIRFLRHVAGPEGRGRDADEQLLHRFARQRDQTAFAALVARHGPMVLGVCGRLLRDPNDVEDAFQATFLVLARKAWSLTSPHLLAPWLYGVARRTALEARLRAARRRARERPVVDAATPDPAVRAAWSDVRPVLDEEIAGLPERYRVPFVLCYLEGRTNGETARLIGCPEGTVASRLSWARQRLRARLTRRGVTLSAGAFAALLCGKTAVAPALAGGTAIAAVSFAGGGAAARVVSTNVGSLAGKVLTQMAWTRLRNAAGVLVTLFLVIGAGGAFVGSSRGGGEPGGREVIVARPLARDIADEEEFSGTTTVDAVEIRTRVAGSVVKLHFKDGDEVKASQLLVEIDAPSLKADLDRAEANFAVRDADARKLAADYERMKDPAEKMTVGMVLDQVKEALRAARELRDQAKATFALTRLVAPVAGRAYARTAGGRAVRPPDVLAFVVSPGPAYVDFDAPLRLLPVLADAKTGLPVAIALPGEKDFPRRGTVSLGGARVDADKGTLRLRATLPNDGIKSGQTARLRLATGKPYHALLVPQGAIRAEKAGNFAAVVNGRNETERRRVEVGPTRDGLRVVKEGLTADDWVVLDSSSAIEPGTAVAPRKVSVLPEESRKGKPAAVAGTVILKDNGLSMTLPLKYVSVAEAGRVVRQVYRDQLARQGRLALSTDDRTNSLSIEGTTEEVLETVKLVAALEELGRRNPKSAGDKVDARELLRVHLDLTGEALAVQDLRAGLRDIGKDHGPRLGVSVEPLTSALVEQLNLPAGVGLLVTAVAAGSPAAKVGVQVNDVLVKIDGAAIPADVDDFVKLIASLKSDTPMDVVVVRKGSRQNLGAVRLADGPAPGDKGRAAEPARLVDRIKMLEAHRAAQKERVGWSESMVKKGYLTEKQLEADRALLKQLEADLERARADFGKEPTDKGGKPQE